MNRQVEFTNKGRYTSIGESVDVGPEYNPAEYSRYTAVFGCINVASAPNTGIEVLAVVPFSAPSPEDEKANQFILCNLTEFKAQTIICTALAAAEPALCQILVFILKDCPADVLPSVGEVIISASDDLFKYIADDRQFNTGVLVDTIIHQGEASTNTGSGFVFDPTGLTNKYIGVIDIWGPYMYASSYNWAGQTPTSVRAQIRSDRSDGYAQFAISFPFFTLPAPQE